MPPEKQHAYQRIAGELRKAIADGSMSPGAKLASERGLAARHGVSLMTARRALMELDRLGLVTRRVGAGTFVAPKGEGVRRLRDPHEEFGAPDCVPGLDGARQWGDGDLVIVEERVALFLGGEIGTLPLLSFLGEAAVSAGEEIWAEGGLLRVRQTIYGEGREVVAVREMWVRGRRVMGWLGV